MAMIDVLLPVRNALPFLGASIESVLGQTFQDWRLLILDHGSTDGTVELAGRYAERDKRVVLLSNPGAEGLGGLLNYGLDRADARIVLRQDGDDISLPNRFETTADIFTADPGLIVVSSEAEVIDAEGRRIGYIDRPNSSAAITASAFFFNPVAHPAAAFNLRLFNNLGARYGKDLLRALPNENSLQIFSLAEDYFLFGQIALLGRCANIKAPLIQYRYHANSESVSKQAAQSDCAISISRFLARSLATMTGMADFDPAPFCSHSECVFDLGLSDYSAEFNHMAEAMRRGLGGSPELERELAFRHVLANRSPVIMAARFLRFASTHGWQTHEYRVARNWLARPINNKYTVEINGGVAPWRGDN